MESARPRVRALDPLARMVIFGLFSCLIAAWGLVAVPVPARDAYFVGLIASVLVFGGTSHRTVAAAEAGLRSMVPRDRRALRP